MEGEEKIAGEENRTIKGMGGNEGRSSLMDWQVCPIVGDGMERQRDREVKTVPRVPRQSTIFCLFSRHEKLFDRELFFCEHQTDTGVVLNPGENSRDWSLAFAKSDRLAQSV